MLSILIPIYNYNITELVEKLLNQLESMEIDYEIIAIDDGSSKTEIIEQNSLINNVTNCTYIYQKTNLGRTTTRLNLAYKARFEWLLFLDADVIPLKDSFIETILNNISNDTDFIFGGIEYESKKPKKQELLRWKYGKKREVKSIYNRKKNPYLSVISQNFLIRKPICIDLLEELKINRYGLDILFSYDLKKKKVRILHIDNPTIHLGLEDTETFIKKSIEALYTTYYFQEKSRIPNNYRPIQKSYLFLRRIRGVSLAYSILSISEKMLINNLLSSKPSLLVFDMYRLFHFIKMQHKKPIFS